VVVGAFRGTEKFGVFFVRESILTACQVTVTGKEGLG